MVALPVIDGIHRVALQWRVSTAGPIAANVMHFKGASSDPTGLFNALNTNVTTAMWAGMGTTTAVISVSITPLDSDSATQIFTPSGSKWAGTVTAADYSPATAAVVSLRTAKRGRRYRGRIYLPFMQEGSILNGSFLVPPSAAQTAWDTFRAAMKTGSWPMHVASYGHSMHRHKNADGTYTISPVTWPPSSDEVIATTVENTLATQRRRQSRLR